MNSHRTILNIMWLLFMIIVLSGCATVQTEAPEVKPGGLAGRSREFASEYERKSDFRQALQRWEIVLAINPGDAEAANKVQVLKTLVRESAEKFFNNGVSNFKSSRYDEARRDFLLALNMNPDHKEALDYLKYRMAGADMHSYEVKKGDTLKSIAQKQYGDPDKAAVISYFNNLGVNSKLSPKDVIYLPVIEISRAVKRAETPYPDEGARRGPLSAAKAPETKGSIGEASTFFESKEYLRVIAITEKMLQSAPARKDARELLHAACYERGRTLLRNEKYKEATAMFDCAGPDYKDTRNLAAASKKKLADSHYIRGVEFFMYEKLEEAIEEWEITLSIDPAHPKAASDILNARGLLNRLKDIR